MRARSGIDMGTMSWGRMMVAIGLLGVGPRWVGAQGSGEPPEFTRYTRPGECAVHRSWTESRWWRDHRPDTLYVPPTGLSLRPETMAAVKACVARFSVATVQPRDLLGLARAYLMVEQLADADAALTTLAASVATRSVATKAAVFNQIVDTYVGAPHPQLAKAEAYMARIDALGLPVAKVRLDAHMALLGQAAVRDSVSMRGQQVAAMRTLCRDLSGEQRKALVSGCWWVAVHQSDYQVRLNDGPGAVATVKAAEQELVPLDQSLADAVASRLLWVTPVGHRAPPIQATTWSNTGRTGTVRPLAGTPSLVVFVNPASRALSYGAFATLRRLMATYAPRGLDVVCVTKTAGYYRNQLVSPDAEMAKVSDYYLHDLKLPVTVAIWHTPLGRREDGAVTVLSAPNEDAYKTPVVGGKELLVYVVDATGTIRMVTTLKADNETMLDHVLQSLLPSR